MNWHSAIQAAALVVLVSAQTGFAQAAAPPTPTTRILAIGTLAPGISLADIRPILPSEVRATVRLYLDGKIDQWFSQQDRNGVVFVLNVTDLSKAREMLEELPLGRAHMMTFELIRLGPLNPLRELTGKAPGA